MAFRPVHLPAGVAGRLWLSSMPGRFESWAAFEEQARHNGVALVVCLTPRSEVTQLSPSYDAAIASGKLPFRWEQLPLPNFGVPGDEAGFRREIERIADALRNGDSVMLHCAAGIGRTGSTAACVLKALGLGAAHALQRVRDAGSSPENARQSGFVDWF